MSFADTTALSDAGAAAAPVTTLSWWLFGGAGAILLLVILALIIARFGSLALRRRLATERMVIGFGLAFPVVVLTFLLVVGLTMTASMASSSARPGELVVRVEGERWWWRMTYAGFETANELVIPTGRPVRLELVSDNVLHSFWVPQLGPKRDMIPGRVNHLVLNAARAGTYWGVCAEYCAGPHALMQMRVHALAPADYARWEAQQRLPAPAPVAPVALRGGQRFLALGCGRCHTVRGTPAQGGEGPDLTHVAARSTIGAGILPTDHATFTRWTLATDRLKPGNLMPAYPYLPEAEAASVSDYLVTLR